MAKLRCFSHRLGVLFLFSGLIALTGCAASAPIIVVSVNPATASLNGSGTQSFTASLTNDPTNAGVSWSIGSGGGTLSSSTPISVTYTAPTVVGAASTVTLTATSLKDGTKSVAAAITLNPVSVALSPLSPVAMVGGATQSFTATITHDGGTPGVTWSATAGTGTFSSASTASGTATVFTATSPVTATSTVITATSKTDSSKTVSVTVPLTPISVAAISPATASLGVNGSQAFTATVANDSTNSGVTWSIGSGVGTLTNSSGTGVTYNAPATAISAVTNVTLTATSVKDPTKSTTAVITLNPISVNAISPSTATLSGGGTQAFTGSVTNDASQSGVTWSLVGAGALSASSTTGVTYTAPAIVSGSSPVSVTLKATSVKDPTKSNTATITLTPIGISFSTATTGISLDAGQTLALAAAVTNDLSASGASFAVTGAGTVAPTSSTGNAPGTTLTATGTIASSVTVTATSTKDTTKVATTAAITVNPAPVITTSAGALAGASTKTAYSGATIVASGGTGAKTFAIASGSLPSGLVLNASTGAISGTITGGAGVSTFAVKVTDSATTPVTVTSGNFTITVTASALVFNTPTFTTGTVGTPYSATLAATGGTGTFTYSVNSGTLPSGMSLNGSTGLISGTPTLPTATSGTPLTFKVTDSATPTPATQVTGTANLIVNPVTLAITSTSLPVGSVGATYSAQLISTGGTGTITWTLTSGSLSGTGLTLSSSGQISGVPSTTQSGLSLTFQAQDAGAPQQQTVSTKLTLVINNALVVTTSSLANGKVNTAYTQSLVANGGSGSGYTWTITSGSSALATLNLSLSTSGVLSGTPTSAGSASFTAQVKDSAGHVATASFTVTVYAVLVLPPANPASLGSAVVSQAYTGSVSSTGGVPGYTWTVNGSAIPTNGSLVALQNGLGLSVSTNGNGILNVAGTPSGPGTVSFTASIADSAGATAGPVTYTISVSTFYSVSGQVTLVTSCGSNTGIAGVSVSINTSPVQTTTTNNTGNFSFTNVPNGTYTVTPSITGPSSIFYPVNQSVTVNGAAVNTSFGAALGYTVSGTATYSGSKTGHVYLTMSNNTCTGNNNQQGTTIIWPTATTYTIRGVPPGTFTLQASMDTLGYGAQNAISPTGSTANVVLTNANLTNVNVTLADPAAVTLSTGPVLKSANGLNTGALVQYRSININGVEQATSYTLQWSSSSSFTTIAGSQTFPATGTNGAKLWLLNGLADGSVYYFRASGSIGSSTSPFSSIIGPVTIGAPTGGSTVSGAVSFGGTATGPLYVGLYNQSTNQFYGQYIPNPASPQAFTVQVPTGAQYLLAGIIDQNKNGVVDTGDITDVNSNVAPSVFINGNTTGQNLTLATINSTATLTTQNLLSMGYLGSGSSHTYSLNFDLNKVLKLPVAATVTSGPNVISPMDMAECSTCGQGYQFSVNLSTTSPTVADTYHVLVTYGDGTSETLTPSVSAVVTDFSTNLQPNCSVACTSTSTTPTFTWSYPAGAPSTDTYQFNLSTMTVGMIWQIPSQNSNTSGFTSSQIPGASIPWITTSNPTDPLGANNPPSVSSLTVGTPYNWQIQTTDSNGNSAVTQVNYQP